MRAERRDRRPEIGDKRSETNPRLPAPFALVWAKITPSSSKSKRDRKAQKKTKHLIDLNEYT